MISNPFRYGEAVGEEFFTGRYREREVLLSELSVGHNVLLTGPRFYGKSSLARKVMAEFERQGLITVYMDLERAYSIPKLIETYVSELTRSAFRQPRDLRHFLESLPQELKDRLVQKSEHENRLTVNLQPGQDPLASALEVLDFAQHTSAYKKRGCVVCFDEITQDGNFPKSLRERIRQAARRHDRVGYLLVSIEPVSKKETEGFIHLPLAKIEDRYLKAYVKTRFENTGYRIEESVIDKILELTGGHPNYTQMVCRELWNLGHNGKLVTIKNFARTLDAVLETHSNHYTHLWRELSLHQKNLLLAVCNGGGKRVFSQEFVQRHQLGGFSTVQKSLRSLLAMQILERRDDMYQTQDLFFQQWLQRRIS